MSPLMLAEGNMFLSQFEWLGASPQNLNGKSVPKIITLALVQCY